MRAPFLHRLNSGLSRGHPASNPVTIGHHQSSSPLTLRDRLADDFLDRRLALVDGKQADSRATCACHRRDASCPQEPLVEACAHDQLAELVVVELHDLEDRHSALVPRVFVHLSCTRDSAAERPSFDIAREAAEVPSTALRSERVLLLALQSQMRSAQAAVRRSPRSSRSAGSSRCPDRVRRRIELGASLVCRVENTR